MTEPTEKSDSLKLSNEEAQRMNIENNRNFGTHPVSEDLKKQLLQIRCSHCPNPADACIMQRYICTSVLEETDQIIQLIEKAGYVQLAED